MGVTKQQKATWPMRGRLRSPGRHLVRRARPAAAVLDRDRSRARRARTRRSRWEWHPRLALGGSECWRDVTRRPVPLSGRYLTLKERGDRHLEGEGLGRPSDRPPAASLPVDDQPRAAAQCGDQTGLVGVSSRQCPMARRSTRPSPQGGETRAERQAARVVQDRLAGKIAKPSGELVAGPEIPWIGRRHGRRADRRWARAWSPEQIANRLVVDFPHDESMRISHEAIYQALYVQGRGALRRELTACLGPDERCECLEPGPKDSGKKFVTPEVMISERPAEVGGPSSSGPLGRRPHHRSQQVRHRHACGALHPVHNAAAPAADARPWH